MNTKKIFITLGIVLGGITSAAQSFSSYTTTESKIWETGKAKLENKAAGTPLVEVSGEELGTVFLAINI